MTKIAKNTLTGQVTTTGDWQLLPFSRAPDKFILYVEGQEVYLYIGDTPVTANSFKVPDGAALEWPATVQKVWIRGADTSTVVYFIA